VALDVHAADQILVYLALAGGESSFTVRSPTGHAHTAMCLIEQFLPVRFEGVQLDGIVQLRMVSRQHGCARPA
jgi:RNA 3'-terminal phosphate cyclase (ATP)